VRESGFRVLSDDGVGSVGVQGSVAGHVLDVFPRLEDEFRIEVV
jgi:hypothetical protein